MGHLDRDTVDHHYEDKNVLPPLHPITSSTSLDHFWHTKKPLLLAIWPTKQDFNVSLTLLQRPATLIGVGELRSMGVGNNSCYINGTREGVYQSSLSR